MRPALCLTNSIGGYSHVVIAFITSQIKKATENSDLAILETDSHFSETGLKIDSAVRLHRLVTIPENLIQRQLGDLPGSYRGILNRKLRDLFAL